MSAAEADSNEAFRDVAEAQEGLGKVAKRAKVNRENLYRAFSRTGNSRIGTLDSVLSALGFELKFAPKRGPKKRTAGSR